MLLTIKTTHPRANDLMSLLWNWHLHKRETTLFRRLGMHSLEIAGLSTAMLIIPLIMHRVVQGFDEMYDILGRRAKSPYAQLSWVNIAFAFVMLVGWHLWLGRLTYLTVLESDVDEEKDDGRKDEITALSSSAERSKNGSGKGGISWSRILGRILIPLLLVTLGLHFGYQVCRQLIADTRPLITRNDVDMQEAMGQLYGLV
ncbi:hypothetical protein COCSADRAFT_172804 [Bipolaris sorokiniana ND90Pr]|uniref:Uncharacterized protein n=1 Tax=Cochliobolus sativus (strain ND90Pr / ATCC 201652) TaxID=665912 RepID=M2SIW8_COCSN|nr:uncharacterized protein COCSADRAFT_172804 [Bipolaris sorokiniana ND90Pr]EMD62330.1 hypothetical protein COCSADRAFT_172804 [Bipolaris sorokiniana ND90Pr]